MSEFFKNFPYTTYNINGSISVIRDLFRHVQMSEVDLENIIAHEYYTVPDGWRPDNVSQQLYDSPLFEWTFFIVNDHLRSSMNNWPLSYQQYKEKITKEYSKYTISIFQPEYTSTNSLVIGSNTYLNLKDNTNYLGGISFNENVVLKSVSTGETAKILDYDFNKLQLWNYDFSVSNISFIDNGTTYQLDYIGTGEERKAWLLEMITYFENNSQTLFYTFVEDIANQNITAFSDAYFDLFQNTYLNQLIFTPEEKYKFAELAPRYYYSDEEKTQELSSYDALNSVEQIFYKSYQEVEEENNFSKTQIKYILPQYINQFAEIYKKSLNG